MHHLNVIGRLGQDAELKTIPSGTQVLEFSVAAKCGFGEREKTHWWDCKLWGKRGESLAKFLVKGQQVAIIGKVDKEVWEKNGEEKSKLICVVEDVTLIGSRKDAEGGEAPAKPSKYTPTSAGMPAGEEPPPF